VEGVEVRNGMIGGLIRKMNGQHGRSPARRKRRKKPQSHRMRWATQTAQGAEEDAQVGRLGSLAQKADKSPMTCKEIVEGERVAEKAAEATMGIMVGVEPCFR